MKSQLSVIIITKNEERNIAACLASVAFADQLIVVDSGSTDRTVELARAAGAQVVQTPDWPGFGPQKQRALDRATSEWVLSLDADERVSPQLQIEILKAMDEAKYEAFRLPRLTNFFGDWIHHSGWYPDYVLRLFKRNKAQFTKDLVHESLVLNSAIQTGHLSTPLIHFSFREHADLLRKLNQYTLLGSEQAFKKGRRSTLGKAILFASIDFFRTYFLRRGFLDGRAGLLLALLSAEAMFHKWVGVMLWSRSKEEPMLPSEFV